VNSDYIPMNATLEKFGYPHTLLKELQYWCILMRPAQVTMGALILGSKSEAHSLAELPSAAFAEMHACTKFIESGLRAFRPFDKINYLALMMVDPHVHFHILPRYAKPQELSGFTFTDPGWPGVPDLKHTPELPHQVRQSLRSALLDAFGQNV
jgi:diadenosine tetraphosphate (Ap4A) HIT family hydrolase